MSSYRVMIVLFFAVFSAGTACGTLFTAKSATTGDWATASTWINEAVPGEGDDVAIVNAGSEVILSGTTSNLNSFTNSKTLTFTNWNSALSAANVTLLSGGTLRLPGGFTNDCVSNNIYVVCSNLFIASGGTINANYGGYAAHIDNSGTPATRVNEYGNGPGAGLSFGGGSYGGSGGGSINPLGGYYGVGGPTNGPVDAPLGPGSSGGTAYYGNYPAGSGGGAVRIQASGTVTVNGTITANGGNGSSAGSGSGGGIYITCTILAGTNGTIQANGGGAYGGGGGGRIAVIYDTNAQAAVELPSILFTTTPGLDNSVYGYGDVGTICFTDNRLLTNLYRHIGRWCVPGFTNWAPNTLCVSNGWFKPPADGFRLAITSRIDVLGTDITRHKLELTNGALICGGDIIVNKGTLNYSAGSTGGTPFACGGNLILTNGATMTVRSGTTNSGSPVTWGAAIDVSGNFKITTNSVLYLYSHATNGGAPIVRVMNLVLDLGGSINADGGGFMGREQSWGYGQGGGFNYQGGGGYGGKGGERSGSTGGPANGNSNAPISPGSAGGTWNVAPGHRGCSGGGAVRIEAGGTIALNGTITANGSTYSLLGNTFGAGSGGGIYLKCHDISGSSGIIQAMGGSGTYANGGGGRIAIWRVYDNSAGITASAAAGTQPLSDNPEDGTIVWGWLQPQGTLFSID